jgi:glycosyltransferase involved in cell wall biosynthesis
LSSLRESGHERNGISLASDPVPPDHGDRPLTISLVIPVFNEEAVLPITLAKLRSVLAGVDFDYEIIFVNDGSRDRSFEILAVESARDARIKVLGFSRNFGHQIAVTAGIDFATGDAVIVMDSDLQDPPSLLPRMVQLYREGYDVVSPQRISRESDAWFKRRTAGLFYTLMRNLSDTAIPAEVGDFRLLSRGAARALRQIREQHRFMRGIVAWLGLREAFIPYERQPRMAGGTKYPLIKMLRFSWTAITSFSAVPLRVTISLGLVAVLLAFGYLVYAVIVALVLKTAVWGWTSIVFLQCFFFGITLICIGLTGEYIARIYEESKNRPLYVVDQSLNLPSPEGLTRVVFIEPRREAPVVTNV